MDGRSQGAKGGRVQGAEREHGQGPKGGCYPGAKGGRDQGGCGEEPGDFGGPGSGRPCRHDWAQHGAKGKISPIS